MLAVSPFFVTENISPFRFVITTGDDETPYFVCRQYVHEDGTSSLSTPELFSHLDEAWQEFRILVDTETKYRPFNDMTDGRFVKFYTKK